jgi:hypothetical protein
MHKRTEELRDFMKKENLKPAEVGEMLGLALNTIRVYCSDNHSRKVISPQHLELLKLKVAARKAEAVAQCQ